MLGGRLLYYKWALVPCCPTPVLVVRIYKISGFRDLVQELNQGWLLRDVEKSCRVWRVLVEKGFCSRSIRSL